MKAISWRHQGKEQWHSHWPPSLGADRPQSSVCPSRQLMHHLLEGNTAFVQMPPMALPGYKVKLFFSSSRNIVGCGL
jgi:hypothetical protein